jgi:hypothetical protein
MPRLTTEERINLIMRKVDKNGLMIDEKIGRCWSWSGSKRNGYGEYGGTSAHRISYKLFKGDIPKGLFVMHICDNRECINPEHLKLGTNQDNIQDKVNKGRAKGGNNHKGQNASYSKLTNEQVKEIRENPHDKCLNCLARQFGVCFQQISRIKHNERWSELVEQETEEQEFWRRAIHEKKVIKENLGECWETIRNRMQFSFKNKHINAHRIAYTISKGEIPNGMVVRHKCDNTKCINPDHLELGTHRDNMRDRQERGRTIHGVNHHSAKIDDATALKIYNLKDTQSLTETSKQFDISKQSVSKIWKKEAWKHIHV